MAINTKQSYYGMPIEVTETLNLGEQYPWFRAKTPVGEFSYHSLTNGSAVTEILSEHLKRWEQQNAD